LRRTSQKTGLIYSAVVKMAKRLGGAFQRSDDAKRGVFICLQLLLFGTLPSGAGWLRRSVLRAAGLSLRRLVTGADGGVLSPALPPSCRRTSAICWSMAARFCSSPTSAASRTVRSIKGCLGIAADYSCHQLRYNRCRAVRACWASSSMPT